MPWKTIFAKFQLAATLFLLTFDLAILDFSELHLLSTLESIVIIFLIPLVLLFDDILAQGHEDLLDHLVTVIQSRGLQEEETILFGEGFCFLSSNFSQIHKILFVTHDNNWYVLSRGVVLNLIKPAESG